MNTSKVLIFSDLDGTLLDHFTYQFDSAKQTIAQLNSAGIAIILNTSKTCVETLTIRKELAVTSPFIVENGAAVFIPKATFATAPEDTVSHEDYWLKEFSSPRAYYLDLLDSHTDDFKNQYQHFSGMSIEQLSELTGLTLSQATQAKARKYGEPVHWLGDEHSKKHFITQLRRLGANVIQGGRFIHVGGHCNKGHALSWLTKQYQTLKNTKFSTIALGDGENDISMLEAADIAIQVRSPVHDFPVLLKQNNTVKTKEYGPKGWSQALQALLFEAPSLDTNLSTSLKKEVNYG